ncbi:MAG TPA: type II and III secretion system protein, partial [Candidatus Omnitrophota bacterium]|nr:type II and III secretion system protein [Candidatus Omnitrophota bacterium]
VRIKSGQTIAIGGLIRENVVDLETKVPILGDIPLLSQVFKHKDKTVQKTDLLFFLTVSIVNESRLPQGHSG